MDWVQRRDMTSCTVPTSISHMQQQWSLTFSLMSTPSCFLLYKFKSDHNVRMLLWLSKVRAEALCGLASAMSLALPSSFLPFAPSTLAMLSSILFPSSTAVETLSHMTCHLFVYSLSHLHENSKLLRTR